MVGSMGRSWKLHQKPKQGHLPGLEAVQDKIGFVESEVPDAQKEVGGTARDFGDFFPGEHTRRIV